MAMSTSPWYGGDYDVWDPFDWRTGSPWGDETTALAHTFVDWRETDTAHVFTAEIPGECGLERSPWFELLGRAWRS